MFSDNSEDGSDVATCVRCTKFASHVCQTCGDFYCSAACQKLDWRSHRYICRKMPKLILREAFDKEIMAVGHPLQEVRGCFENNCPEDEGTANNSFKFEQTSQKLEQNQNVGKSGRASIGIQQASNVSLFDGSSSLQRGQESPQLHNTEGQYVRIGKQQFNHDIQQGNDAKKRLSHGNQHQFKRDGEQFDNNEPYRQANDVQKCLNLGGQQQHNSESALKRNQQNGNSGNKGSQNYDAYEPQYADRSSGSLEDRNGNQQQGKQQRGPQQCNDGLSRRSYDNNQQRSSGGQQQRNYDGQQQRNNDGQRQRNSGQQRVQDGQQPHNNNYQQQRNNNGQQQQRNNDGQQQQRNNNYQQQQQQRNLNDQQQRNYNGQQQRNNDGQQQQRNYSGQQHRNNDGQQQQRNYNGQQQRNNGGQQQQQQQRNNNGQQLRNNDGQQQQQRNYNGQHDQNKIVIDQILNSDSQDNTNDRRSANEGRQWHNRNSQHDVPQQNRPDNRNISNSNSPQQSNENQNRNPQNYSENRQRNYQSYQTNQGHNEASQQERQFNNNERQDQNIDQSTNAPVLRPPFEIKKLDANCTNFLARIIDTSYIKEGLFACIPDQNYDSFINMQRFLAKMDKDAKPYKPVLNEYCLALFEEEWYRAKVIGAYGNEFEVEYIDFTNERLVKIEDIRRYPLDLTDVNSTSLCKLAGLPDQLSSNLVDKLEDMVVDFQKLYVQTVKKCDKFYEVECPVLLKQLSELGFI
ncbi:uncharacterized protein DDB_G0290685-like [Teleopsis dalmanni]|uniref:uncharacterized protein DDB_G0290685-like n=1 Tax=Teleopsis dalmanni TaxID=139649 RepID=UPI0018CE3265|nr:uncharacterized protein DDB_G0290685-like [Teleopsis dalmanni]XP_037937803.1 uncharacterized protein DDB_G0290685-like [Teleopsis dalmanni]